MKGRERHDPKEQELKEELERLRSLFDGIDEPIYVSDPDTYEILFANKKLKETFGEKILGKKCYKVFQNLNKPCPFCTNKYIFGENLGKTYIWEFQNRKNKRWYRCIDRAIRWHGGKYVRYEMAIDITEHKLSDEILREREELFRSIVENSHNGILIIDDNFRFIYVNDELSRILGYPKEEIIGQDFRKFLDKESKALVKDRYLRRQRGENVPSTYEFKIVQKNGNKRDVRIKSTVIKDRQGKVRTVAQILDITEHKLFEERLSTINMYGQKLNAAKSLKEIYKLTLDAVKKTLGFEHAGFLIVEKNVLRLAEYRGYPEPLDIKLPLNGRKGISVRVVKTGKSVYISDVRKEKAYFEAGLKGMLSELAVPVKIGKKIFGVLNVESKRLAAFDENDRKLLEILASHAAIAISNLKRQKKLSALNIYGRGLNRAKSMQEIYTLTLNAMEKVLEYEYASFFMVEGNMLRLVAYRKYPKTLKINLPLDGEKGVTVKAAREGKTVYIPDIRKEKAYVKGKAGMLSELAVPIKLRNKVLGILNAESERLAAFDEEDEELLELLASHAAIAISNLKRQKKLEKHSHRMKFLMKSTTKIMHAKNMHERLRVIAKAIKKFGWRRVVISLRDENLEGIDVVTAGLTREEIKLLMERKAPGYVWRERLGPKFKRFKIGEFYYLPWSDPWVRENVHKVPANVSPEEATTYAGVPSRLSPEEMVDWHPQDMLYAPLRTPEGRIVGILSMDDPVNGRKPTNETLAPLEIFLHQAAIVIENAQLIDDLKEARKQLEAYADELEQKVEERTRELKKSQEQLLKAQRLAVIGELAGMVGHDLRNPLTSIAGATYYLKRKLDSKMSVEVREMLELIEKNIAYSNKIINDLLDYSREIELELSETNPKTLIKEALSLVKIPENVQVINLAKNKPKIKCDVEKIKRTFVNLIKNAVEAMPNGGKLTIRSRKVGDNVEIIFTDTGVGMSKETLKKLWVPLFTTKAKGMGFGLPICKRFIEAHGGCISCESTVGKGTTFKVTLPIKPKKLGGEKVWVKMPESSLLTTTKT